MAGLFYSLTVFGIKNMKPNIRILALVLFQLVIIGYMVVHAMMPLITGKEIHLRTTTRDPRDIFRGDYAVLTYGFNSISPASLPNNLIGTTLHFGDEVYLSLSTDSSGFYHVPTGLWLQHPDSATVLRCVVQDNYSGGAQENIRLEAGIESYFTDSKNAQSLDSYSRLGSDTTVVVNVMLANNGQARIKSIELSKR